MNDEGTRLHSVEPARPASAYVSAFFDREAAGYDRAHEAADFHGHVLRARLDAVLRLCGPGLGDALDVGMGPGRGCAELDRLGWRVSGVDASPAMVDIARRRLPSASERMVVGTTEQLPFASQSFDLVVACGVLFEYSPDPPRAIAEIVRVLRPAGSAILSVPNARSLYGRWRRAVYLPLTLRVRSAPRGTTPRAPYARPPVSRAEVASLMGRAALHPRSWEYVGYGILPSPLERLLPRGALRLSERFEAFAPRFADALATQLVVVAGKDGARPG